MNGAEFPCKTRGHRFAMHYTAGTSDIAMTPRDPYIVSMSLPNLMHRAETIMISSRNSFRAWNFGILTGGRSDAQWLRDIYEETRENVANLGHDLPEYEKLWKQAGISLTI